MDPIPSHRLISHEAWSSLHQLGIVLGVLLLLLFYYTSRWHSSNAGEKSKLLPLINPGGSLLHNNIRGRITFQQSSKLIIDLANKLYPTSAKRILTDNGVVVMLPNSFANEIRNDPRLSFSEAIKEDNHAAIPGFEVVGIVAHERQILQRVVRKQLTKHLTAVIGPLSEETAYALTHVFGESTEWRQVHLKATMLDIIARISSGIYLGDQMCRNEEWLRVTREYTKAFFDASVRVRVFPRLLRPVVHWFLPECRRLRVNLARAKELITPLIEERRRVVQHAREKGQAAPAFHDSLSWAEEESRLTGARYDPAHFQLTLALLAIHTTFDLLQQCVLDLARHPEFVAPMREEIVRVLAKTGWKKSALHEMRLLDSAIKESQRLKPGSLASMRRKVTEEVTLSNGLFLPKGSRLNVDSSRMMDPSLHTSPDTYDPYRFLRMRTEPGREFMAQLVSTSPDHLGFGHGEHSCPGRFFAANEIKVALCHMIMKYDWKLVPGTRTEPIVKGMVAKSSPWVEMMVRKREGVELDLDGLEVVS